MAALLGLLAAILLLGAGASMVSALGRGRRRMASLVAIDFVRSSFASRLGVGQPVADLLPEVTEALRRAFLLAAAEVWTAAAGTLVLAVADPPRAVRRLSLTPQEERIVA